MSFWSDRGVLVTGCTGFLGFWLTRELVARGARVIGLVRDVVPWAPFFIEGLDRRVTVVRGRLEDYGVIERTLNEYEVDCVFHLAAQAIVGVANRNPMSTFESNIKGTWVVLEASRRSEIVTRVVVASSDKAYGVHDALPYDEETHALQGRHPYDVSKSCADLISLAYAASYSLPVSTTRCSNLFGPGDLNLSRLVPGTICAALEGERPVIRSDGSPVRDYIHVDDVVAGYLALAERLDDERVRGRGFNLGTGEPRSVLELTEMILRAAGRVDLEPQILGTATNEIDRQFMSSDAAQRLLAWTPRRSLAERLGETVDWYRAYLARTGAAPGEPAAGAPAPGVRAGT